MSEINVTRRNGHEIWWTAFNKPRTIFGEGGDGFTFYYDANHSRVMQTAMADGTSWSKFYIGSLYEEEHKDGNIEARHYIPTPAGVVGVWIENSNPALGEFKYYSKPYEAVGIGLRYCPLILFNSGE